MKPRFLLVILFAAMPLLVAAQKEQDADTLVWNNRRYLVTVDRNVPSILQVYFQRSGDAVPFTHWSSNNSRGHVATYELIDDGLYLLSIEAKRFRTRMGNLWSESGIDTVVTPDYFEMHLMAADSPYGDGPLLADWFSGVVQLTLLPRDKSEAKSDEAAGHRYLRVEYGKVLENILVTDNDVRRLYKTPDAADLKPQRDMLDIYGRFNNFYTRCLLDRERVVYKGHEGLFEHGDGGLTMVMEVFRNDPLRWVRNWNGCCTGYGAPFGTWQLRNDSLFVTAVHTHWGRELYSFDSASVDMLEATADSVTGTVVWGHRTLQPDGSVFADWLDGDYVIHYGTWVTNSFGVPDYSVFKTQKLRVDHGVVLACSFSPRSFDDDERQLAEEGFKLCNPAYTHSVADKQLSETVGNFRKPKTTPQYKGGKTLLRNWFANHPLTDERARERLFRLRIGFMVNCEGEAGQWQILNKGKGELFEFGNMVLDIVKDLPQRWEPATDKSGNAVDCWQILEFTVSNGSLSNVDFK